MCPTDVYVDQSPKALNLTVVEGELDINQFTCLRQMTRSAGGLDVTITIIGASHVLSFCRDGTPVFHEILACVQPANEQVQRTWPLRELPRSMEFVFNGIVHQFVHEFYPWRQSAVDIATGLVETARTKNDLHEGVYFEFPQGDLDHIPVTVAVMYNHVHDNELRIVTAHSYPGQGLVKSTTTITNKEV